MQRLSGGSPRRLPIHIARPVTSRRGDSKSKQKPAVPTWLVGIGIMQVVLVVLFFGGLTMYGGADNSTMLPAIIFPSVRA
uniref:Uncharacterized protein n=1 Tax=Tetraselmis sp. GSL018 TaxID=582737 RepID=A0A061QKE8_9CHLO